METALTPLEFLRRARKLYERREAVVDGKVRLTYGEFAQRCDRASAALAKLGVKPADRVGTIAPNTHQHLEHYYSIPQLGAVIVPMNYRLSAQDLVYIVAHSGCTVLAVDASCLDLIEQVRDQMPGVRHFISLGEKRAGWLEYETLLQEGTQQFARADIAETDLLAINYTSGTTARPKGVMITHRNAWVNAVGTLAHWPMGPADRYLWTLPMFHANGWTFTWIATAAGATHVCLPKVDPTSIATLINQEKITALCAAPTVLISIATVPESERQQLRKGVRILTAGAPPAATTIERIEGQLGWQVTHAYGLTETSPLISFCVPMPEHEQLSADDRARMKARQGVELMTSGELRVVDADLRDVPKDGATVGEIVARGNVVMRGYYNDPEATEQAFAGGWFHSGDAAVVHPDGYIEIRDRFKDVIISGGENISSIEVEGALLRHPAVLEVAVIGVPHDKWGESPKAYVVLKPNHAVSASELREFARGVLTHFKVPTAYEFVDALPKTATGKLQKHVLRRGAAAISTQ
jgi:fatty-acyl-CoA synthase